MSSTILSTKKLTFSQKELLYSSKINVVDYDAIHIEYVDFELPTHYDFFVFTSQNAVKSALEKIHNPDVLITKRAFCVGNKTKLLLESNGFQIIETTQNAADLAKVILNHYAERSFALFSGNLSRDEIPKMLKANNIRHIEVQVYKTSFNAKKFDRTFEGVLFFSPSGVRSFIQQNSLDHSTAFCIGATTAAEAKKYTNKIIIPDVPTIEYVLAKAIKHYAIND